MPRPKKRTRKRSASADQQLELPVGGIQLPAVVADAPLDEAESDGAGEDVAEAAEVAGKARLRRASRARPQWWHRHWNLIVGLCFVPFAWIFTDAFFETISRAMAGGHGVPFWMRHEFVMFAFGAVVWFLWLGFCLLKWRVPRPMYLYVLGHELTHAAIATLFLGKVHRFRATSDGGYIETNRYNFLIALAPYLWPFYSIPILAAWSLSLLVPGLVNYREYFLVALGFTWMFHLTFTVWMLPKGQTDFRGPGLLFSFTIIYLVNVLLLSGALVSVAPAPGWRRYFTQIFDSAVAFYNALIDLLGDFGIAIVRLLSAVLS